MRASLALAVTALLGLGSFVPAAPSLAVGHSDESSAMFRAALRRAEQLVKDGRWAEADVAAVAALERDPSNPSAWAVRAAAAAGAGDTDLQVHCLHKELRYLEAQATSAAPISKTARRAIAREVEAKRAELLALDPVAEAMFALRTDYSSKFTKVAETYEKNGRPHGAIRVWKEVLALDPESAVAAEAIERIASAPDPTLAADAKPKDLFEGITDEWIAEHDAEHTDWKDAARAERDNYFTVTNAGYEVLIRTAEAMEQMAAFYKQFFRYGTEEDGRSVPRITVHVFKSRDEYLELGIGPPVEWSAGHFTGSHVECYIGDGGFAGMVGTLFHEAAHQYVSLATGARSWLNEGLASFFEGTRILPNGAVVMNEPADHRLFPLAERMEAGWMANAQDGFDANDPNAMPTKAPTWRIVVESAYSWGPPWYAPTWGVVYFCYNFQDPIDGRFVYRDAFMNYVDKQGGKAGKTAISTFEEVVLADPKPPYKGLDGKPIARPGGDDAFTLPANVDELTEVWKDWILALRDERTGKTEERRPYGRWARLAAAAGDAVIAKEHFEKGLLADGLDVELALDFARHLESAFKENDRAAKIVEDALRTLESAEAPDDTLIAEAERLLGKLDPKRRTLTRTREQLAAAAAEIVDRYEAAKRPAMVQEVAWRFGSELGLTEMFDAYADAVEARGEDLSIWSLAYNEHDLDGWTASSETFLARSAQLVAENGDLDLANFDFTFLTLDRVTAGDMSLSADIQAEAGKSALLGFVFGAKSSDAFHGAVYFPPRKGAEGTASSGFLDLMSSYGGGLTKAWRHVPILAPKDDGAPRSTAGEWHNLRLDVTGRFVDVWWDGELKLTHEFASRELLLGQFGVLTGSGTGAFKNVRFLSRDPASPAGRIERRLRMARSGRGAGDPVGGSYLGLRPPFPTVGRWAQSPARTFEEAGPVPQMLVFWSIAQNDIVPIDGWLRSFAQRWESVGLRVISVVATEDDAAVDAYLKEHPMPGSVGVDLLPQGEYGMGRSFEAFAIAQFNLPRVLILDVDGTVEWEGDPGFSSQTPPKPPYSSYIDLPMEELVTSRRLVEVAAWRERWTDAGAAAMARGDLVRGLPRLAPVREFGDLPFDDVRAARAMLAAFDAALADPTPVIEAAVAAGAGPALEALVGWAVIAKEPFDAKMLRRFKKENKGRPTSHWKRAVKAAEKAVEAKGPEAERVAGLLEELADLDGALVRLLEEELRERGIAAAATVEDVPGLWLARNAFGW